MALVVPMRRDGLTQSPSPMAATQPPDQNFLLMAAALMHRDGRLIKKGTAPSGPTSPPQTQG